MNPLSSQKQQNSNKNRLEIVFFTNRSFESSKQIVLNKENNDMKDQNHLLPQKRNKYIDEKLLDYKYHYFKDIQSNFVDVELGRLLLCPKIISSKWQIRTVSQWQAKHEENEEQVKYWFPIFYNQAAPDQYFNMNLQLIAVILQKNKQYQGFLGYVPENLQIIHIIKAICEFYDYALQSQTMFLSHLRGEYLSLQKIQSLTVKDMANCFIKICSPSHPTYQLPYKISQFQSNDIDPQEYNNYNMQSIATNHGITELIWRSDMEIETCDPQRQIRLKLISLKGQQQLYKLKNRIKLLINYPKISIPEQTQPEMDQKLNTIAEQIQKYLNQ